MINVAKEMEHLHRLAVKNQATRFPRLGEKLITEEWLTQAWERLTATTRSEGICERCGKNPATQVHHKNRMATKRTTRAKIASDKGQHEQAQALCRECHLEAHHGTFNG